MVAKSLPPPADWPSQADQDYDRIRVLGAGAFGEVWLARSKRPDENGVRADVAIKGVSTQTEAEGATAAREIAILLEMNHPNVVRLLHDYEPASPEAKGRYMALSFVNGPDLGALLEARGAFGLPLAQLVARHLIAAVAYCHARGVMHRDIKPDNIMLEGCREGKKWMHDDVMWGNKPIADKARFRAVLADFGFARATSAADYEQPAEEEGRKERKARLDRHKSRIVFQKRKSAVGTLHFAAPEIASTVSRKRETEVGLTCCVSSYGLIADAYAIGATLSEICTGVPPGQDVQQYVKENRKDPEKVSKISKMKRKIIRKLSSGSSLGGSDTEQYDIQLRYMNELPEPAMDLITSLMKENMDHRMSAREAQDHEWIGGYDTLPHGDVPSHWHDPIVYIQNEAALI